MLAAEISPSFPGFFPMKSLGCFITLTTVICSCLQITNTKNYYNMEKQQKSQEKQKLLFTGKFVYRLITIYHYLFGAAALVFSFCLAVTVKKDSQISLGCAAIIFIILFALTQPDIKFKRLETGWHFLDKKMQYLKKYNESLPNE